MSNKQQTAITFLSIQLSLLEMMRYNGAMEEMEYLKAKTKVIQEAREMEKEQMIEFALAVLMEAYATVEGNVTTELTIQEYYNLKYGK
jgi:hypothetical protein